MKWAEDTVDNENITNWFQKFAASTRSPILNLTHQFKAVHLILKVEIIKTNTKALEKSYEIIEETNSCIKKKKIEELILVANHYFNSLGISSFNLKSLVYPCLCSSLPWKVSKDESSGLWVCLFCTLGKRTSGKQNGGL